MSTEGTGQPFAGGGWTPPQSAATPGAAAPGSASYPQGAGQPAALPAVPGQPATAGWGGSQPATGGWGGSQPATAGWGGSQPATGAWGTQVPYRPTPQYAPPSPYPTSPYGGGAYPQPYNPYAAYGFAPWAKRPEAPSANTSMILGIISIAGGVLLLFLIGFLGIAAVILGNKAKREIKESRGYYEGTGKVTAGLVCGWIGIGYAGLISLLVLFLILAAMGGA